MPKQRYRWDKKDFIVIGVMGTLLAGAVIAIVLGLS